MGIENTELNWQLIWDSLINICIDLAIKIVVSVLVLIIGRIIIKAIVKRIRKSKLLSKGEATAKKFFEAFVKIALNVSLAVLIVAILGVPMASIVAVIGSVGVAISLAVQGTLSNLASGIMLLVFKPYKLDDYIESGDYSGTVTDLGVFYTTLTSPDNKTIVIPNSSLTSSTLVNYSTKDTRRLDLQFNVEYGSDIEKVKSIINGVLARHGEILPDVAPFIRLTELRDSSLCITVRVWCRGGDFWTLKFNLLEEITKEFNEAGIVIPYNRMTVKIENNDDKRNDGNDA